jgi:peptidoglycan/xylan/chitin deacetylase (PgdA/CDA1 family)
MAAGGRRSLILTYHRITDDDAVTGFYDVPVSHFRKQIARIAAHKGDMRVVVTFDDGTKDHLRAANILADHGLQGVFFIVHNWLDEPDYLFRAAVFRLVELGQIVGSHTLSHRQLPSLSDADLSRELIDSRLALEDLAGRHVEWFAPPGGFYDGRTLATARDAGYRFTRTMDWGYAPDLASADALLPTVPILRTVSDRRLQDILAGEARFRSFAVKQWARRILPARAYTRLRNWSVLQPS